MRKINLEQNEIESSFQKICDKLNCQNKEKILYYIALNDYIQSLNKKIKEKYNENIKVITLKEAEQKLEKILEDYNTYYYIINEHNVKDSFLYVPEKF